MKNKKLQVFVVELLMLTAFLLPSMNSRCLAVHAIKFSSTTSAPPLIEWNQTYGGTGDDKAFSMVQTSDGGYALAGYTNSSGSGYYDFYLVKTDANGNMQWNQTYGGTGDDKAFSMVQTSDGGYALAGYTNSSGNGGYDFCLVKTDSNGNMVWNHTYGGSGNDEAYSVIQTSDGGYALAGYTTSSGAGLADFWLVKTNASGDMVWQKCAGGAKHDIAYSVIQTSDGGYALAGRTMSFGPGENNFWLVKRNSTGDAEWNQAYGRGVDDEAYSVIQTAEGGYALAGYTCHPGGLGGYDFCLVKTNSNGDMQWNQTYDLRVDDEAYSVIQTSDGGYALAGTTASLGAGYFDFWLVKTNSSGDMVWNQTYGGAGYDEAHSVVQTSDGGYALAGYTSSYGVGGYDFYLVKARLCTLTIQSSTGGTTDPIPGTYNYSVGEVVTINATPSANYLFDHWRLDSVNNSTNPITVTMNANHSLQAFFTPSYTLTVNATAGGTTNPMPGTYIYSNMTVVNVTAFPNTGYFLYYWELDGNNNGTPNPISIIMNTNHTLKAVFVLIPCTLTITATAGGTTSPSGWGIYSYGDVVNITAWPSTGYYFDHWDLDGVNVGGVNPVSITMNKDYALHAVFEFGPSPSYYNLTITATAGGTTSPTPGNYIYSNMTVVNVTASPDTSYYLNHWELDGNDAGAVNPMNVTMDTDHTLHAVFLPHHDVSVINVASLNKTIVCQGYSMNINVTVTNQGDYAETFNLTAYANATIIGSQNVTLPSGNFRTVTFTWNTTGFAKGNYTISAYAEPVQGETHTADNMLTDGIVKVTIVGDVNADGKVNLIDVFSVALAYGSYPGHPTWNPNYDVNDDHKIDLIDYFTAALSYGKTDP
jgi:hypothetical protein